MRILFPVVVLAMSGGCSAPPAAIEQYRALPERTDFPVSGLADYVRVDKSDRTLTLFRQGWPMKTYYGLQFGDTPTGHKRFEGDERTPEGRYYIDTRNPDSAYHLSLRISYPDQNDRAYAMAYGQSPGGNIFIHGQPNGLAAGRMEGDWTDGCIAVSNEEIEELWLTIPDGTIIDISP
ncbi:MAG: murein L,D-transpeptidase family protein [Sphingomonadaceae bacterium]